MLLRMPRRHAITQCGPQGGGHIAREGLYILGTTAGIKQASHPGAWGFGIWQGGYWRGVHTRWGWQLICIAQKELLLQEATLELDLEQPRQHLGWGLCTGI